MFYSRGEITCDAPIKTISYKLSLNYVHQDGKECKTIFERLSYNGKTSVVRCRPKTGRTHQIRVHLRYLGYPIANDPTYSDDQPWSPLMGYGQTLNDQEADKVVQKVLEASKFPEGMWNDTTDKDEGELSHTKQIESDNNKVQKPRCEECGLVLTEEPKYRELKIWLHAWRYAGDGWAYETKIPDWAHESFVE